jgi:hypothetical protein
MDGTTIVASCDTAEVFHFVDAAFDAVSLPVSGFLMRDRACSASLGGNDGFSAHIRDKRSQVIGVEGLIGDDAAAFAAFQQGGSHFAVMNLARR